MASNLRTPLQLMVLLVTLVASVDDNGRPSLLPSPASAAGAGLRAVVAAVSTLRREPATAGAEELLRFELTRAVKQRKHNTVVYMPAGFWMPESGHYDLVVHFHGGSDVVEPQHDSVGLNAVLVTINLGLGSRAYREYFGRPRAFESILATIDGLVDRHGPASGKADAKLGRLALSSWSAGYGAVSQILADEDHRARIDAVFLGDGIHASYDARFHRQIFAGALDAYVAFAELAVAGDKLMRLTHSQIPTYGYASTTETAKALISALSLETCKTDGPKGMQALTCSARGDFSVRGFVGNDKDAHCKHVLHMDELVLRPLKARWAAKA